MRHLVCIFLATAVACATDSSDPDLPSAGGKFDLPNDPFWEREHDAWGYREIANFYQNEGYDPVTDLELLDPAWPMPESGTALLTRFGTPVRLSSYGYFHTALDIYRRADSESADVLAPFAGTARVFDWYGTPGYGGQDYRTVVAVWDPQSHVIAQLMHVKPAQELVDAGGFVEVAQGQMIGSLADDLTWLAAEHQQRLRHTHTDLIDGGEMLALNPARYFDYHDSVAPEVVDLYLLDENAEKQSALQSGQLDVVLELFDRDDDSERNFEVGSIEFQILDQAGNELLASPRCTFDDLYNNIATAYTNRTLRLIDFGNAADQYGQGDWPDSDIDYRDRTFRYALTQFTVNADGKCDVYEDADGFLEVLDEHTEIRVNARIWDSSGNMTELSQVVSR